ncbi:MAG: hypothetical protein ACHQRJ_03725 [Alphaproteobacteria bacterium]
MSKRSYADALSDLGSLVGLARQPGRAIVPATLAPRAAISPRVPAAVATAPRPSISATIRGVLRVLDRRRIAAKREAAGDGAATRHDRLARAAHQAAMPIVDAAAAEAASMSPSEIAASWDRAFAAFVPPERRAAFLANSGMAPTFDPVAESWDRAAAAFVPPELRAAHRTACAWARTFGQAVSL